MSEHESQQAPQRQPREPGIREVYRQQMLGSIGGWSGTIIAAIPTVIFVAVNALTSLRPALFCAVGAALALTVFRLWRKQSTQQALSGLFGVLVAAFIAGRTGEARGYFLLGIIMSFVYAVPFGLSILMRRPLVGVLWEFLDPTPGTRGAAHRTEDDANGEDTEREADAPQREEAPSEPWYRHPPLLRAYSLATLTAFALFMLRGCVQAVLYHRDATGWLAAARIGMGFPLYVAALGLGFWVVRQARRTYEVPASA
jgi:hypothetical protein